MGPEFPITLVAIIGGAYVVAALRRGSVRSASRGGHTRTLDVAADPDAVFEALRRPFGKYRVDDADAASHALVLSVPPSPFTWGFFFPIWITPGTGGGSVVEIGIRSKLIQIGPLVTRAHDQCVAAIEALLVHPPTARVVT
jgi:hypothetical protein